MNDDVNEGKEFFIYNGQKGCHIHITLDGNVCHTCDERCYVPQLATHVKVHPSVKAIKERAYNCCVRLTTMIFNERLKEIGEDAFSGCKSLHEISIPPAVKAIKKMVFYFCSQLTTVQIGEGVEEIGGAAFDRSKITSSYHHPLH
jgi:hypothetical protein